jgi:hypothetical protein
VDRPVFEIPDDADAVAIQSILDKAAEARGRRPVVHFGTGVYLVDRTLVIPPGSDMQLVGDGLLYATVLQKKAGARFTEGAMILVKGPSTIDIRDMQIAWDREKDHTAAVVFVDVDQPGAQAHIDQLYSHEDTSLAIMGMNYLYVEKNNSFFSEGNFISGGDLVKRGGGTARLSCYGGQFERLKVVNNAKFLGRDCWWEGDDSLALDLQGSGTVCIDGAIIAPNKSDSSSTIAVNGFKGHLSLMNMYLQGAITPRLDNPDLDLLLWNVHFYYKMDVLDFLRKGGTSRAAFVGLTAQCFQPNAPACKDIICIGDRLLNESDTVAVLERETAFGRESRPVLMKILPPGISNIYITRLSLPDNTAKGIAFEAGKGRMDTETLKAAIHR